MPSRFLMPSVEYVGCVGFFLFGVLGQSSRPLGNMVFPLGEADKEARPAMPGPEGLRHVFRRSLEYVGLRRALAIDVLQLSFCNCRFAILVS